MAVKVQLKANIPQPVDVTKIIAEERRKAVKVNQEGIRRDFKKTTRTWDHKVTFFVKTAPRLSGTIVAGTDDEIYNYVSGGTKAHAIRPKPTNKSGLLAFQANYKAKTIPRKLKSRKGGSSGPMVFRRAVKHPGTKARLYAETIAKKWQPKFAKAMERADIKAAARINKAGG